MPAAITTVNFGTFVAPPAGTLQVAGKEATVTVTGQSSILAGSIVDAWIVAVATADHSVDEHMIESFVVVAGNIVANTSFEIRVFSSGFVYGLYSVAWAWQ